MNVSFIYYYILNYRFVNYLNPRLEVKSRSTLSRKMVPILYKNLKETMDAFLNEELTGTIPGVSFTSDGWSSRKLQKFLSLTLHIIDSKWRLHRFVIHCQQYEGASTGNNIMLLIDRMIDDIPIIPKAITTMVTDGEASMKKAMEQCLNINEHLVCIVHTIQNCLRDAFAPTAVKAAIGKAHALATATHKSAKMNDLIRQECQKVNGKLN